MVEELAGLCSAASDFDKITQLETLQRVANSVQGAIARVSVDFDDSQREEQRRLKITSRERGRGVADQIALARRISPHQASRDLRLAKALRDDLPATGRLLATGRISERAAHAVHRETDHLDASLRREVDADLARVLPDTTVRGAGNAAKKAALTLDPDGATTRARKAVSDRAVWFKPARDGMCKIVAFLPAAQGLVAYGTLKRDTVTQITGGDAGDRTRSQVMADLFTERLTGQAVAQGVPVEVQLIMPANHVFGDQPATSREDERRAHPAFYGNRWNADAVDPDEPSWLNGYGPIPAAIARGIIAGAVDLLPAPDTLDKAQAWVRRIFTDPTTGHVTDIDTRRRVFDGTVRRFITLRDQVCRTPGCDAPIRDIDHITRHADGGVTTVENGVGVCQRFNLVKETPGWHTELIHHPDHDDESGPPGRHGHTMRITTPTGKTYYSTAPPIPGAEPPRPRSLLPHDPTSFIERTIAHDLAWTAGTWSCVSANPHQVSTTLRRTLLATQPACGRR